jgi:hypothetical protein
MSVFRVQNPVILAQPLFAELLERALASREDLFPDPEKVMEWLRANLHDPQVALFLAVVDDVKLGGLLVASVRTWVFSSLPWLLYVYSDHWKFTQELCTECQKWFLEHGFDRCYGFNTTPKDDQSFERLAEHLGCRVPTIVQLGEKSEPEKE